jgi:hypothetical protein
MTMTERDANQQNREELSATRAACWPRAKRPFRNPLSGVLLPPERRPDPIVFRQCIEPRLCFRDLRKLRSRKHGVGVGGRPVDWYSFAQHRHPGLPLPESNSLAL